MLHEAKPLAGATPVLNVAAEAHNATQTTISVWTVTSDTDNGTETSAHGTERAAYEELRKRFCRSDADLTFFDQQLAASTFGQLMEWVSREAESRGLDHFSVQTHTIETSEASADPVRDEAYRQAASTEYADEGRIEIDSNAVVSYGDDDGAYVAAWVWVDRSAVPLCPCGARNDDGEGFNGLCGSCADRAEATEATED